VKRALHVERRYPHPVERVWRALTDARLIAAWLMKNDFSPVVGHRFTLRTDPGPGFDGVVHCEVLEIEAPRRMRWSWRGGPIDTVVTFTLTPVSLGAIEGTRLEVVQTGFEGLGPVLVSVILGSGNRAIYGRKLPAVLDRIARGEADTTEPPAAEKARGLWWWLARAFAPVLRRGEARRRGRG
jgi:uncharacterized protein YndB with AHSA1/START domain